MTRPTSLVGAAARYTTRRTSRSRQTDSGWQEQAWQYYSTTPEVRFGATWIGNAMSGARLYAGRRADDGTLDPAPDDHPAAQLVASIAGGPAGQSQLLGDFGPHLVVAGEGWIVIRPREGGEDWRVLSVLEISTRGGSDLEAEIDGETIKVPAHDPETQPDPMAPIAIRVWDPHPRRHLEADSPVRSSLDLLEELHLLNASVKAIARSRLTGRGIMLVPQGLRFPSAPGTSDAEDDLIEVLMQVAETAIRDPESAAATVPIIVEVPGEAISQITLLKTESDFDELAIKLRDEAIRRFATGLEIPAEVLLGLGETNHWGVWQLSAEAIRLGVEPRLGVVADALTTQWLRPLLEADGVPDAHEWVVWYDTSPLRVRQNRSATALELFKLGAISAAALRRETGFEESDAPEPDARPADAEDADLPGNVRRLPVDEAPSEPNTLPASATAAPHEGLIAAVDGLIWHALSTAGEKLLRTPACPRSQRAAARELDPATLHTRLRVQLEEEQIDQWRLLDGAWARLPEIARRYGADPGCLTAALERYCRDLITAREPHAYEYVPGVLDDCTGEAA